MVIDPALTDAERALVEAVRGTDDFLILWADYFLKRHRSGVEKSLRYQARDLRVALSAFLDERGKPVTLKWEAPPNVVYPKLGGFTMEDRMKMAAAEAPVEPGGAGRIETAKERGDRWFKNCLRARLEAHRLRTRVEKLEGALRHATEHRPIGDWCLVCRDAIALLENKL